MFALGCLIFIKHLLQNNRQLLEEMKPNGFFWVQMMCCCSTVEVSVRDSLVMLWDIFSQATGDGRLIPGCLAPSNAEFEAKCVTCSSLRVLEVTGHGQRWVWQHMRHQSFARCGQHSTVSLDNMRHPCTAYRASFKPHQLWSLCTF